jgi:hypothetical protein
MFVQTVRACSSSDLRVSPHMWTVTRAWAQATDSSRAHDWGLAAEAALQTEAQQGALQY